MATIISNENGQVVEARDSLGTYYYLADGLGTPTAGYWLDRDAAHAALDEEEGPGPDGDIDESAERIG
jgi:hypothetical protein